MEQSFSSIEEVTDYIEYLTSKGKTIPQWVLNEKTRIEKENTIQDEEFIFGTMAAHNKFMTPEKEKVVRDMTDQLLIDAPNAAEPCLLLGKVQCGKTDTFLSIMGLCFDRGIDMAVVMTKGTNTLTKQTIQRLDTDFRFFKDKQTYGQKIIITVYDIMDLYKMGGLTTFQLNDPAQKFIIVVKKEITNLTYLNELFERDSLMRGKKVLVCDDEADFASRAYYQRKGEYDLLKIADQIDRFIKQPSFCRYLQITATPYSLYLQPDGTIQLRDGEEASPWLPRYTGLVPIHERYIGGKQYFELSENDDSMYSLLYQPVDKGCIKILSERDNWHDENNIYSEDLKSLNYAIVSYLFATAVRVIQRKKVTDKLYKSSCLIHCEISKKNHKWQEDIITKIIDSIRKAFLEKSNSDLHILEFESEAYDSLKESNRLGNKEGLISEKFPSFAEVEAKVKRILEYNDFGINVVNSEEPGKVASMLNEKGQLELKNTLNFFIGGSILDRGITIDNMLCFFYGRSPKKYQMDTVLQHARMYGARDLEDMACTRFFTTEAIYDVLKSINSIDSLMYEYLKAHRDTVRTNDFTSMVIGYDGRIKASAANKYTPSNTLTIRPHQQLLPKAFQTGTQEQIGYIISSIDGVLKQCPGYEAVASGKEDFFMMDYDTAVDIINEIDSTFRYGTEWENEDYEWNTNDMITALDHCCFNTDGMLYCMLRIGRNVSRERDKSAATKGRWIDAPADGHNDLAPSRQKAIDRPVLILLKQNGSKSQGWMDAPFYWPVLLLPQNMEAGIFASGLKKKAKENKAVVMDIPTCINPEDILSLTIKKPFFFAILSGEKDVEYREIKKTTASLYLMKDQKGNFLLSEGVKPDEHYTVHSLNDGVFPFRIKPIKYLRLRTKRDATGSQLLVKLKDETPYDLVYAHNNKSDIVYDDENVGTEQFVWDQCVWTLCFNLDTIITSGIADEDEEYLK